MSFFKTYQIADSTVLNNSFDIKEQDELELIEEVDEPIKLPKFKKKYYKKFKSDTGGLKVDTFYGIKNEEGIPIRHTPLKNPSTESPVEILFSPKQLTINIEGWQTLTLIFTILLLGIAKAFSKNRFFLSIKALFNHGVSQEITREEKVFFHRSNILFTIIHLFTTSLFLYHIKEILSSAFLKENNILDFIIIIAFLAIIYLVKYLFSTVLFFTLDNLGIASEYIFNVSLYNNLLGVILIPILSVIYFSPLDLHLVLTYLALPLIALTFLLRLIRLFVIGISNRISYFYIFLYICTLEILPLVVLFKIFIFQ